MILKADKEGGFVVLPNGIFGVKASEAFNKNFKPIRNSEARVNSGVVRMCKSFNLDRLATARDISSTSGTALVFSLLRRHISPAPRSGQFLVSVVRGRLKLATSFERV